MMCVTKRGMTVSNRLTALMVVLTSGCVATLSVLVPVSLPCRSVVSVDAIDVSGMDYRNGLWFAGPVVVGSAVEEDEPICIY